jgi:glycosyltransferase involved in cell wall biosynthesis
VSFGWSGRMRRGYPVNDFVEMLAARRTIAAAARRLGPRALVLSTTTAAMLAPRDGVPYAVRLDAPARVNRPGARNAAVRALERRGLGGARLLLPWSEAARSALPPASAPAIVVPPPVEPSGPAPWKRERLAVAYVPDPKAKGLEIVCGAWAAAEVPAARLAIFGIERERARAHLARTATPEPPGIEWPGMAPAGEFRSALRHARLYVGGARWEDFGQAPLEALADGALLATVPSGGPFEALSLARRLEPALVAASVDPLELGGAVRAGFELPEERVRDYRAQAAELVSRFRGEAIQRVVSERVLPALLG